MPKKTPEEIKKEVRKLISDITEVPEKDLKEDAKFVEDLGIDSMMALEIVASLEKKYKVVIPEDEIPNVRSLANVYQILEKLINK
ncbi:MAG: acyl carrier protein [Candidatus Omnitrophica bacterium]|nr:acyl carrier protein [Candidatus Omnitrophota bacterium]